MKYCEILLLRYQHEIKVFPDNKNKGVSKLIAGNMPDHSPAQTCFHAF
jgi:hypothetical protein